MDYMDKYELLQADSASALFRSFIKKEEEDQSLKEQVIVERNDVLKINFPEF